MWGQHLAGKGSGTNRNDNSIHISWKHTTKWRIVTSFSKTTPTNFNESTYLDGR